MDTLVKVQDLVGRNCR